MHLARASADGAPIAIEHLRLPVPVLRRIGTGERAGRRRAGRPPPRRGYARVSLQYTFNNDASIGDGEPARTAESTRSLM